MSTLQNYAIPLNPITKTPDFRFFFSTIEGKEFANLYPLSLHCIQTKEELKSKILQDIVEITQNYNQELYVYLLKNSFFEREFAWNLTHYSNIKKETKIPECEQYYFGNKNAIKDAIERKFPKSFKGEVLWAYKLCKDGLISSHT